MKFKTTLLTLSALLISTGLNVAFATTPSVNDLSGQYECKGTDSHDGKYKGMATLTLDPKSVTSKGAGYDFKLVDGTGANQDIYTGFAAFDKKRNIAVYFANANESKADYGVAIAHIANSGRHIKFSDFYYEPMYAKTGSTGFEVCTKVK